MLCLASARIVAVLHHHHPLYMVTCQRSVVLTHPLHLHLHLRKSPLALTADCLCHLLLLRFFFPLGTTLLLTLALALTCKHLSVQKSLCLKFPSTRFQF